MPDWRRLRMLRTSMPDKTWSARERIFLRPVVFSPVLSAVLLIAISSAVAVAQPRPLTQPEQQPRLSTVVTGQECLMCHEEVTKAFAVSPHGKAAQFLKGTQATSCETCHGDPTRHN